jgi:hypothetical protein
MATPYETAHRQSIQDPDSFRGAAAEDCYWYKRWDKVLDEMEEALNTIGYAKAKNQSN